MERSVGMRADYLRPRLDLLRARLEPGERVLAQGGAFEPYRDSFALSELISGPGCVVAVTDRRVLWVSRSDRRWMQILPYAAVRSYLELLQEAANEPVSSWTGLAHCPSWCAAVRCAAQSSN